MWHRRSCLGSTFLLSIVLAWPCAPAAAAGAERPNVLIVLTDQEAPALRLPPLERLVSNVDLAPTLAGLAGVVWPTPLPGRDLLAARKGELLQRLEAWLAATR